MSTFFGPHPSPPGPSTNGIQPDNSQPVSMSTGDGDGFMVTPHLAQLKLDYTKDKALDWGKLQAEAAKRGK